MSQIEVRPFEATDVRAAARLLAERHTIHRRTQPLLSPRYQQYDAALAEVTAAWDTDNASGAVAVEAGEVIGYLLGAPKASAVWGSNVWVEAAGQAVRVAETVRDLYAVAADMWHDKGYTAHYVLAPADDSALIDAWFRLAFGAQQAHALMQPLPHVSPVPPGLTVRRAGRGDIDVLAELDLAVPAHQALSPMFSAGSAVRLDDARADWEESIDDPEYTTFVAKYDGRVIGSAVGCSLEKSSTHGRVLRSDSAGFLGFAAVLAEHRGLGAGRALGEAVCHWAGEAGYDAIGTDWRVTNLLSSRTWPRLGFRPTFLRLHRLLGH